MFCPGFHYEGCRIKTEFFFYSSNHIWEWKRRSGLCENMPPPELYLAIKQQRLLFTTEHTGVGWFRSGVSNDALRDARL